MLTKLFVQNFTLIKELEFSFEKGFSVITGETGAGKSIIIGALSLIMGKRAEMRMLMDAQKKCIVEAWFEGDPKIFTQLFEKYGLDEEYPFVIRREISTTGKSRAFINDTPVTVGQLKQFTEPLIHVHSQHQLLLLKDYGFQCSVLDSFAGNQNLLSDYSSTYSKYLQLKEALKAMREKEAKARSDQDYLQFLFDELDKANLVADKDEHLEQELAILQRAGEIRQILGNLHFEVLEKDEGISGLLSEHIRQLERISDLSENLGDLNQRLASLLIELNDIAEESLDIAENTEIDEQRSTEISERLDLIQKLMFKHKKQSVSELIEMHSSLSDQLLEFSSMGVQINRLEKEVAEAYKILKFNAERLSLSRKNKAPLLAAEMVNILKALGMPDVRFIVQVSSNNEMGVDGQDHILFLFSANKGVEPDDLAIIASGGEMSRIMLAVQSIASGRESAESLIFDEIDTGISGNTATKTASIMAKLSQKKQLLVITHLPQVAAKANHHYKVYKETDDSKTISRIKCLNELERAEEIALMMSGVATPDSLSAAKELLEK